MPALYKESIVEEWVPDTAIKIETARHQMESILASSHFRNSKRYPVLLRYVVEAAIRGQADTLKERSLGVAVFQRPPDYDTNNDPIVRITAGEVRKRIAQYYHDPGHEHELLIDIPPGSYIPQFKVRSAATADFPIAASSFSALTLVEEELPVAPPGTKNAISESRPASLLLSHRSLYQGVAAILVVALCVIAWTLSHRQSVLDSVWEPLLKSGTPVIISIPEQSRVPVRATEPPANELPMTVGGHIGRSNQVALSDVQALVRLTGLIETRQHAYRVQAARATTFTDLRQGPTVLVGGFDNAWTLRALKSARYVFAQDSLGKQRIEDKKNPSNLEWTVDLKEPYEQLSYDYAIVARLFDTDTRQPVIVVAGVGENGTKAAAEFLTDPPETHGLAGSKSQWRDRNFEVVLGTQVINGVSGPPRILATEVW